MCCPWTRADKTGTGNHAIQQGLSTRYGNAATRLEIFDHASLAVLRRMNGGIHED
jgi:hypothetical protein